MKPNLNRWIRDYFGFSSSESRGFLVLLSLIFLLLLTPFLLDSLPDKIPETNDTQKLDSIVAHLEISAPAYDSYKSYEKKESYAPGSEREKQVAVRFFAFNPNTISAEQWQELGVARWMAERILKYRAKGGSFRRKEDLLRIYDFPKDTYQKLEPYIQLPEPAESKALPASAESRFNPSTPPLSTPKRERLTAFDLNEADTTQLKKIYGIGSKLAVRIIKFRDNLGGFVREEQIREVWGLDSTVVRELLKYGQINSLHAVRKLRINDIKAEDFRHPYLKPYVAKAIMAYRNQHGAFRSAADLKAVKLLDEETLRKLEPYLTY